MIDQLWLLKFVPMFNVPGNAINAAFDDEKKAREIFDRHAKLLSGKPDDAMEILVFDDLTSRHCIRPAFFPYCEMMEVGPCDMIRMEINRKVEASHKAAGFIKENLGFRGEKPGASLPLEQKIEEVKNRKPTEDPGK